MTRWLTVTCSAPKCQAEGRVQMHGLLANDLPSGWHVLSSSYGSHQMEFCSLECILDWTMAMLKARKAQRAWQSKPLPVKPIDMPTKSVPVGALL